jgi:phenylalanyl-tRNA synthetase beta chain
MLLLPEDSQIRKVVKVANPLSQEQGVMRTILLPGLLENISRNLARKNKNLAFFELGSVFCPRDEGLPEERLKLGAVVCGSSEENWLKKKMDMDFFFLKGILEKMLKELEIQDCRFQAGQNAPFHPGRTALLLCDGIEIGILGEIHPLVLQNFDIKERTCAFELDVESLFKLAGSKNMKKEIAKYPAVERDIAILLEEGISSAQALSVIEETETDLLQDIIVFDIYSGKQVPAGYKSIAFRLILQSRGRTLTENDVNTVVQEILERLENKLGASLR